MDFIKENAFFVAMGAIVLISLAMFVFLQRPAQADNDERLAGVEKEESQLKTLVAKKLPNEVSMENAKAFKGRYERQFAAIKTGITAMGLSNRLPGLSEDGHQDPGTFVDYYQNSVNRLKRLLTIKDIKTGPDTWSLPTFEGGLPREEAERELVAKEFALTKELVDVVTSPQLRVMQVDRITVDSGLSTGGMRLREEPYFDVYPFVLEVRMPIHLREVLLRELLSAKRKAPMKIRKIDIGRLEGLSETEDRRIYRKVPPLYVTVVVTGQAFDYRPQSEVEAAGGVGGPPPRARTGRSTTRSGRTGTRRPTRTRPTTRTRPGGPPRLSGPLHGGGRPSGRREAHELP